MKRCALNTIKPRPPHGTTNQNERTDDLGFHLTTRNDPAWKEPMHSWRCDWESCQAEGESYLGPGNARTMARLHQTNQHK